MPSFKVKRPFGGVSLHNDKRERDKGEGDRDREKGLYFDILPRFLMFVASRGG